MRKRYYEPEPRDIVREIMRDNPGADNQLIRNLVYKQALADQEILRVFVDATTDNSVEYVVHEAAREKAKRKREREAREAALKAQQDAEREATDAKFARAQQAKRDAEATAQKANETKAFASLKTRIALNGKPLAAVTRRENGQFARFHEAVEKTMPQWAINSSTLGKTHGDKLDKLKTWE